MVLGSFLAIGCAFVWSLAVILFKKAGGHVHPAVLNLVKNFLAFLLMIPTLWIFEGSLQIEIGARDLWTLFASGIVGIALADFMVLKAISLMAASRIAILECSYSPFVIVLSIGFLGETLTTPQIVGCVLVISAILCVTVRQQLGIVGEEKILQGSLWATFGLFTMAVGIVMTKPIFDRVSLLWVIELRLIAGMVGSLILFMAFSNKKRLLEQAAAAPAKGTLMLACVLSTYLAMIMWVGSYKYIDASNAAILNQTSTIFTVLLAVIFLKERLTLIKILGTALAVSGVLLITLS